MPESDDTFDPRLGGVLTGDMASECGARTAKTLREGPPSEAEEQALKAAAWDAWAEEREAAKSYDPMAEIRKEMERLGEQMFNLKMEVRKMLHPIVVVDPAKVCIDDLLHAKPGEGSIVRAVDPEASVRFAHYVALEQRIEKLEQLHPSFFKEHTDAKQDTEASASDASSRSREVDTGDPAISR